MSVGDCIVTIASNIEAVSQESLLESSHDIVVNSLLERASTHIVCSVPAHDVARRCCRCNSHRHQSSAEHLCRHDVESEASSCCRVVWQMPLECEFRSHCRELAI